MISERRNQPSPELHTAHLALWAIGSILLPILMGVNALIFEALFNGPLPIPQWVLNLLYPLFFLWIVPTAGSLSLVCVFVWWGQRTQFIPSLIRVSENPLLFGALLFLCSPLSTAYAAGTLLSLTFDLESVELVKDFPSWHMSAMIGNMVSMPLWTVAAPIALFRSIILRFQRSPQAKP